MKYLIIGDPDFLGAGISESLKAKTSEFMFLAPTIGLGAGAGPSPSKLGKTVTADTSNEYAIKTTFSAFRPDVVLFLCKPELTPTKFYDPLTDYSHYTRSALALGKAIDMYGTGHVYMQSSYEVYGAIRPFASKKKIKESDGLAPLSMRGAYLSASETLFRLVCSKNGAGFTSLRYFEVVGKDPSTYPDGLVQGAVKALSSGRSVLVDDKQRVLDFITHEDAVNATVAVMSSGVQGPINIGTGNGITIKTFFAEIKKLCQTKNSVIYVDSKDGTISKASAVADVSKLSNVYSSKYKAIDGLKDVFDFYRTETK